MKKFYTALVCLMFLAIAALTMFPLISQASTTVAFPSGVAKYTDRDGNVYTPDANGQVTVPDRRIDDFLRAGFVIVVKSWPTASTSCTKGAWSMSSDYSKAFLCVSTNQTKQMFQLK